MTTIEYMTLDNVDAKEFISLLNKQKTRTHLIHHDSFDTNMLKAWMASKIEMDTYNGCKIRAILVNEKLAGWCGIQFEDKKYEIAIVIDDNYWGIGTNVFIEIMKWAKDIGHKTVFIHLLHTRPKYKFLHRISKTVYESEILGCQFTTYELEVKDF